MTTILNTEQIANLCRNFPEGATVDIVTTYPKAFQVDILENGFIARVGCKQFAFSSLQSLLNAIELYIEAPEEAEKKYCNTVDKYTKKRDLSEA